MSKTDNRDDFSRAIKQKLAERVAFRCSNPKCRVLTIGPKENENGSVTTGIACHIFAAAPNGPRANPKLSSDERSSINNGIWLCSNCSALIDKDSNAFPPELLLNWKTEAEQETLLNLNHNSSLTNSQTEKKKSINYSLIDNAISDVIRDSKLHNFLNNEDFTQPYYRPILDNLFELLDIIEAHSNEGSPYDSLYEAISAFRVYLALNAFWYNSDGYYILGEDEDPEIPRQLAKNVATELRKI